MMPNNFEQLLITFSRTAMFGSAIRIASAKASQRSFHSTSATMKVAVLGANGGIGQPLSMLLKLSPQVDELSCYDIVGTPGVAADLSHVSSLVVDGQEVATPLAENL